MTQLPAISRYLYTGGQRVEVAKWLRFFPKRDKTLPFQAALRLIKNGLFTADHGLEILSDVKEKIGAPDTLDTLHAVTVLNREIAKCLWPDPADFLIKQPGDQLAILSRLVLPDTIAAAKQHRDIECPWANPLQQAAVSGAVSAAVREQSLEALRVLSADANQIINYAAVKDLLEKKPEEARIDDLLAAAVPSGELSIKFYKNVSSQFKDLESLSQKFREYKPADVQKQLESFRAYINDVKRRFPAELLIQEPLTVDINDTTKVRYEVDDGFLGAGGTAYVVSARKIGGPDNEIYAIKILQYKHLEDQYSSFTKEGRRLSVMDHPNIVKGYGIGEIEVEIGRKQPFIVMEYIPNHLGQLRHFRSIKEGLTVARGIIRGLGYAWTGHQTLHRDIKPQNVLLKLSSNQELALDDVKVADFGISKKVDKTSPDTATALFAIKGTISYLWPEEIVISGLSAEAKTTKYEEEGPGRDIYATGILLYEKYFGSLPPERTFRKPDEDPKNEKVQKEIVKRYYAFARAALNLEGDKDRYELKKPDSTFPEPVWQLIKKATAMDPALRYQNSAEFEAALDQIETELAGMEESASPLAAENPASFYASLVKKLIEISVSQDSPLTTPEMRSYLKQMNAYYQQDPTNDAIGGLNGYVKTRFLGMPVKAGQ